MSRRRQGAVVDGGRGRPPAGQGSLAAAVGAPTLWRGWSRSERLALGAILLAYLLLGGLYLATVPFGCAPDEQAHLRYVRDLAGGRVPVLRMADREGFEAHQPPLAYALALPAYVAAGGRGGAAEPGAAPRVAVRLVSLLLGVLVIALVYAGTRLWLPGNRAAAALAAAVAAFMPMRLAVFASFSNDPLTELLFCATLVALALGLRGGFGRRRCLLVGALLGLGLLTKTTCALLAPVALVAVFLEWRRHRTRGREYGLNVLLMLGVALAVGGPWLARNVALYGDPFALGVFDEFFHDRAGPEYFMTKQGLTFAEYLRFRVMPFTQRSFWGVFDHMNLWMGGPVPAPPPGVKPDLVLRGTADAPIYLALEGMTYLLGALGVWAAARWWRAKPAAWQRDTALAWGLCALLVLAAFARFNLKYFQGQARYLYPAVLPIAAGMAAAWLAPWPERRRAAAAAMGGILLAALALYAWHGTLLRYFGKVGW